MAFSFCVLGSGSAGNSTLLMLHGGAGTRHVLIDAGLSPRETAKRLGPLGVSLDQIDDVLLTHADHDHLHRGWPRAARRLSATWRMHRRHLGNPVVGALPLGRQEPFVHGFELAGGTAVQPTDWPA